MTEPLLSQQLESPSGTGRVEPRVSQRDSPHHQRTGYQQTCTPILTGKSVAIPERVKEGRPLSVAACCRSTRLGGGVAR